MEQVRVNPRPRASSPEDPNEWTITEDGFRFGKGDQVYDYYDCRWVIVAEDPSETYSGWFDVQDPETGRLCGSLNSVRVASQPPHR